MDMTLLSTKDQMSRRTLNSDTVMILWESGVNFDDESPARPCFILFLLIFVNFC